ncbi:MAG: hypothetical protein RJA07_1960 [Bacteroidota bacterium]
MINQLRKYYYLKKIKSVLEEAKKVNHRKIDLNDCKSVGILFDATEEYSYTSIEHFADRLKIKDIDFLGFINFSKKKLGQKNIPFNHFLASDVNWYGIPQNAVVDKFMQRHFDILFNLTANNNQSELVLDYIMANSKSSFRVGEFKEDKDYCYDFMINLKSTDKLPELIKQIEMYLPMFNEK